MSEIEKNKQFLLIEKEMQLYQEEDNIKILKDFHLKNKTLKNNDNEDDDEDDDINNSNSGNVNIKQYDMRKDTIFESVQPSFYNSLTKLKLRFLKT